MTNINCVLNCIYQKDGKCCYECISKTTLSTNKHCSYFVENCSNSKP